MSITVQSSISSVRTVSRVALDSALRVITATGESGTGKNFTLEGLRKLYPEMGVIQSFTTREHRGAAQDPEYRFVDKEKFVSLQMQMLWCVEKFQHYYGTLTCDVNVAVSKDARKPSVMHLIHEKVPVLQEHALETNGSNCVFSFLMVCSDEDMLRRRMLSRDPKISERDISARLEGIHDRQEMYRQSGFYHALIESHDSRTREDVLEEVLSHLSRPIPKTRAF